MFLLGCVHAKTTKKMNQESALTAKKADLEGTQKELDAALAYPMLCISSKTDRALNAAGLSEQ